MKIALDTAGALSCRSMGIRVEAMEKSEPKEDAPLRLLLHGRVQGVGFRESMIFEALRLGARGWVRNRTDGTVEAVFDGTPAARAGLLAWARRGPRGALVTHVEARAANTVEIASIGAEFTRMPTARSASE